MNKCSKRKRIKLECLECGSQFDDDYKTRHEKVIHSGRTVKVKNAGAPSNPFEASKRKTPVPSTSVTITASSQATAASSQASDTGELSSNQQSVSLHTSAVAVLPQMEPELSLITRSEVTAESETVCADRNVESPTNFISMKSEIQVIFHTLNIRN